MSGGAGVSDPIIAAFLEATAARPPSILAAQQARELKDYEEMIRSMESLLSAAERLVPPVAAD